MLSPDTFGAVLLIAALDHFGPELLQWDPTTIAIELEEWLEEPLPPGNFNKLMAAITIVGTDLFQTDLAAFIAIVNALWDGRADVTGDIATVEEIAWAIVEALLLSPPEDDPETWFHPDIREYIRFELAREGFVRAPDILKDFVPAVPDLGVLQEAMPDDPQMVSIMYQVQQEKVADVDMEIRENLAALIAQLQQLPLKHGSTKQVAQKLQGALTRRRDLQESTLI